MHRISSVVCGLIAVAIASCLVDPAAALAKEHAASESSRTVVVAVISDASQSESAPVVSAVDESENPTASPETRAPRLADLVLSPGFIEEIPAIIRVARGPSRSAAPVATLQSVCVRLQV
ncbi:MAG TPA: hypothetical protein VGE52_13140 [Pirellulales bacterium]